MQSSFVCHRSASTEYGMRRILKKLPPVQKYIRQAVAAGVYYPVKKEPQQQRFQKPVRKTPYGTSIDDYPVEYQILTLNPPIPFQPRLPKKLLPQKPTLPTDALAKKYMKRAAATDNQFDYYQRLLGIPSSQNSMSLKSSTIHKAHAFATKQYQVMCSQGLSEDDALDVVEDLLQKESLQEQETSRSVRNQIVKEQETATDEKANEEPYNKNDASQQEHVVYKSSIPSVLHSKQRTIAGLEAWSRRLEAVPYKEFTVGATVSLDHWIARSILELEEATWLSLLEGDSTELTSRGRDIIAVRQALFPETILEREEQQDEIVGMENEQDDTARTDKTIDELLASLGAFESDDDDDDMFDENEEDNNILDEQVSKLVDELQEWRAKNVQSSYTEWSTLDQEEFDSWLKRYVATLTTDADDEVDLVATREALLSVPPVTREESRVFWDHVQDEASAQAWLQELAALPGDQGRVLSAFYELPIEVQIAKLVELGALEPLLNEYTAESDRVKFLQRHSDKLLEGLEMEHVVSDPNGPLKAQDMGDKWMEEHGVDRDERFSIRVLPYSSSGTLPKQELYQAYNTHRAGRARYEEAMFRQGKLGLRYGDDAASHEPKEEQEE